MQNKNSQYEAPVVSSLGSVAELTQLSTYEKGGSGGDQFSMAESQTHVQD